MTWTNFTPVASLLGGVLIGGSSAALLLGAGRIAGVSGILSSALSPVKGDGGGWRLLFVAGLVAGGVLLTALAPGAIGAPITGSLGRTVAAAVLVGVGVELGAGCTSGHGVCGIGRFSPRSIVATAVFMATAMLTVLAQRALGGAS